MPRTVNLSTVAGREFKRLLTAYTDEFGPLSAFDVQAVLRAIEIEIRINSLRGQPSCEDTFVRLCSEHRRLLTGFARGRRSAPPPSRTDVAQERWTSANK